MKEESVELCFALAAMGALWAFATREALLNTGIPYRMAAVQGMLWASG